MSDMSAEDLWRQENEKRIRDKLGMKEDDATYDRPDYWKEWQKVTRKRECQTAAPLEYKLTDDQLENYPSYGWPLRCAFCGFGVTRIKAADCDGVTFICSGCGRSNSVRRHGNWILITPVRLTSRHVFVVIVVIAIVVYYIIKQF